MPCRIIAAMILTPDISFSRARRVRHGPMAPTRRANGLKGRLVEVDRLVTFANSMKRRSIGPGMASSSGVA